MLNKLREYVLILTDNCNLRCTYCYDNNYSDRCSNISHPMSIDMIPDLIKFINKTHGEDARIVFFGGEPLLNFDFIKEFIKHIDELNFEPDLSIVTNGTLLTSEIIDFLIQSKIHIAISIDGIKEANMCRVDINGKPIWDKVMHIIPEVKAKDMATSVSMVVTDANVKYLYSSYKYLLNFGFVALSFDYSKPMSPENYKILEEQLEQLFVRERLQPFTDLEKMLNINYVNCAGTTCTSADEGVTIDGRGKIYFCHQFVEKKTDEEKYDFSYGNIYDEITNEELFNLFLKRSYFSEYLKDNTDSKCSSCGISKYCKGGCIAEQFNYKNQYSFNEVNTTICDLRNIINNIRLKLEGK